VTPDCSSLQLKELPGCHQRQMGWKLLRQFSAITARSVPFSRSSRRSRLSRSTLNSNQKSL